MNLFPLILGFLIIAADELVRAYHITGLPSLAVFFLPVVPIYLLFSAKLQDKWERLLLSSGTYLGLAGLALFVTRLILFIPLSFGNVFLISELIGIISSSLLCFGRVELKFKLSFTRSTLPILGLLTFTALFYASAATMQDSWQKELRQVKWAEDVFQASESGVRADVLQFAEHPQLHMVLGTVTAQIFGFSQESKAFLHTIFAVFEVLALILLSKYMFKSTKPGFAAAFFLLSSGLYMHITTTADYAAPHTYFQLLTFYALYRYVTTKEELFSYLLAFFFSISLYAKPESLIFLAPILLFLLLKNITPSVSYPLLILFSVFVYANPKPGSLIFIAPILLLVYFNRDIRPQNFSFKPTARFLFFTAVLILPFVFSLLQADEVSNKEFGPLKHIRTASGIGKIETILDMNRFQAMFAGTTWGFLGPNAVRPQEYLSMLLSGELGASKTPVYILGGDNIGGAPYETLQMYLLYVVALAYFSWRYMRQHTLFIVYTLYGFLFVIMFFWIVDWTQMSMSWILGFLAAGYLFTDLLENLTKGSLLRAAAFAVMCFVLISSFVYTANTMFNFNYYSGVNFYREALFRGDPVFGAFAVGKYIREHTTVSNTYLADNCYLSEVVVNRNVWSGAAPQSYGVLPTDSFPNSRAQHLKSFKDFNFEGIVASNPPDAIFLYKGFPYADVYKLSSKTNYMDEGVCIEASEYAKDYKTWGLFFSGPSSVC